MSGGQSSRFGNLNERLIGKIVGHCDQSIIIFDFS